MGYNVRYISVVRGEVASEITIPVDGRKTSVRLIAECSNYAKSKLCNRFDIVNGAGKLVLSYEFAENGQIRSLI